MKKINLRNMIFVVSNLGPFSVSVFFSDKNLPTKIRLRKHSIHIFEIVLKIEERTEVVLYDQFTPFIESDRGSI